MKLALFTTLFATTVLTTSASAQSRPMARPRTYAEMYDAGWFRTKGVSLDLGIAYRGSTGGFGPAMNAVAVSALVSFYPVPHFGIRAGARGTFGAAHSKDGCGPDHCVTVGMQFPVMAVLAAKGPNYGPYLTAGVGIYTRDWALLEGSLATPVIAKFGAGYKVPTSNDSAVDLFAVFDIGRYTKEYGWDAPDIEAGEKTTTFIAIDLGASFDLGL